MVFLGTVPLFKHFCEHLMAEEIYQSNNSLNDTNQGSRETTTQQTASQIYVRMLAEAYPLTFNCLGFFHYHFI